MNDRMHLVRRAISSFSNAVPLAEHIDIVRSVLNPAEYSLWSSMQGRDKRHSVQVYQRFMHLCPDAEVSAQRGALLHDVGKIQANLGWLMRIIATLLGPLNARMRLYLDHEMIGARMLADISEPLTTQLVGGAFVPGVSDALKQADNI